MKTLNDGTDAAGAGLEHLKAVMVGHVDHGKSTILGRLLADTGSLPQGKLEQVKESCARNARPFEYAFLLDALKNERSQGITIDMARCFFKTPKRNYIVMDAPGHIEFLKNMVTGAARSDAALLVIDAAEGVQENSRRHGYMLSMLGVPQLAVLVNKIDIPAYSEEVFLKIVAEYSAFLKGIGVEASSFIPVSGREGDNIAWRSMKTPWHKGPTVIEQLESFRKARPAADGPFRMPVQDIYKFTEGGDDRRIVAGTIVSGTASDGDSVVFLPSGKTSVVKTVEEFNAPGGKSASAPFAAGFTLTTQIYARAGEIMCRQGETLPLVASKFKANVFWLSRNPLVKGRKYKLKLATARVSAELVEIVNALDASDLDSVKDKSQLDRHDVGLCVFETSKPVAFDRAEFSSHTGRFVVIDNYEISGGGVIIEPIDRAQSFLEDKVRQREASWDSGLVTETRRNARNRHRGKAIVFAGGRDASAFAKEAEAALFDASLNTFYLGFSSLPDEDRDEAIERLGGLARIMTEAGTIFITAVDSIDQFELERLRILNRPRELLLVAVGGTHGEGFKPDVNLDPASGVHAAMPKLMELLRKSDVITEYFI